MIGNFAQTEIMESVKDEYVEARGGQKYVVEKPAELEVMETVKDDKDEISKEQDNMVEKRKIVQLTTIEAAQQILTTETKSE